MFFFAELTHCVRAAVSTLLLVCACSAVAADAPPQPAPTREQVERRLVSVATLIDSSSGAQQIERSGNAQAHAKRSEARELRAAAEAALRAGDLDGASRRLDGAAQAMVAGVRLAAPEQVTRSKEKADFESRLESTRALLEAQRRIATEKGIGARDADLLSKIDALIAEAQQQANAQDYTGGRRVLDNAYVLAKASVSGLRSGDTLVRSLNFATKEEEYRYEIDRNDTHRMLMDVLLKERARDAATEEPLREAARLRGRAEEQSARGDFEGGVKSLEESTRAFQRVIRSAGIYIPG